MPTYALVVLVALVAIALVVRSVSTGRTRRRAQQLALERLGFRHCPERSGWLQETVTRVENNGGFRYEVREPMQLAGHSIYRYLKIRHADAHQHVMAGEEILFPLERPSPAGLVLTLKPWSLAPGIATRVMAAVATGPWDSQPDDLERLELPPELRETNLVAAMGPPGARLYDLLDARALGVVLGLGDAGVLQLRFRDSWCAVAAAGAQIPFRPEELVARLRPLL